MILIPFKDVLLVKKQNNLWSKVIDTFLDDKDGYVHSEYVVDDWMTVGTDIKRPVSIHPFGYNLNEIDIYRYIGEITPRQKEIITESIQKLTKTKYDVLEAVCLGAGLSCKGKKNNFICITLITQIMEKAGMLPKGTINNYKGFSVFTESGYFKKVKQEQKNSTKNRLGY